MQPQCAHDSRTPTIDRIEVVRIRPQIAPGCTVRFSDTDFASSRRDAVYYVRALQEDSPTINGEYLRCKRDPQGQCIAVKPCYATAPTASTDDCLSDVQERAWSSPIFVD